MKLVGTFINSGKVMDEYAKSIGVTTTELDAQDMQIAAVAAIQENLNKNMAQGNAIHDRQDKALSRLSNTWLLFKIELSNLLGGPAVGIVEVFTKVLGIMRNMTTVVVRLIELAWRPLQTAVGIVKEEFVVLGKVIERFQKGDFTGFTADLAKSWDSLAKVVGTDNKNAFLSLGESVVNVFTPAVEDAADATLKIGGGLDVAFATMRKAGQLGQAIGKRQKAPRTPRARRVDTGAADRQAANVALRKEIEREITNEIALRDSLVQQKLNEMDLDTQRAAMFENNAARIIAAREKEAAKTKATAKVNQQAALGTANAVISGLEGIGVATIAVSALRASFALAVGALAVAEKGIAGAPQLAAGIFAAAQFAITAGQSPPSSAPSGGGGLSPGSSVASGSQADGVGGPTVINIFGIVKTKAELGAELAAAGMAAKGTGMVPA